MQILGPSSMYFDAVVVEVKTFFTFIQIGSVHTVWPQNVQKVQNMNDSTYFNSKEDKYKQRSI